MLTADVHERLRQHVLATLNSRQITQSALGEMAGMRQAHISNFVQGRRGLSIDGMDAILKVLGLDVADLIALSEQMPSPTDCSPTLETVPLVEHKAAMKPTFGKNKILGEQRVTKLLLRRLKAEPPEKRTAWVRFIAIRADASLAAPMHPRLSNGSVLLVDRHYCSLAADRQSKPDLYVISVGDNLLVRWAEMQNTQLCLRPERSEYTLTFIGIDSKHPLTSCIVGRVAQISTVYNSSAETGPYFP